MKYKPILRTIDAWQFQPGAEVPKWVAGSVRFSKVADREVAWISARPILQGDWITKDASERVDFLRDNLFKELFEVAH